ncbi:Crp/Fnr family transcriptional regulator [Maridesulfovibrio salexigens]|uniref:Transcriptional regulator, Crp/Fnr family n=1 Tax=Maridesulfovibrio salexigens (strain ATCC 14822 / DSM 2638 / NCIMB 8403 / VKM B-1763) TaxID=526222 RepID=C6BWZ8_MARSD|nr:Crp/Fnr family transcriptional regulator [Maridesulfovibrio salexigens]ACS78478.1 transcriptional regulator, Crp/Fnr family [Maridesulfovibrio salexigens DSM 2638]
MSTEKIFRQEKAFFSIEGINSIWEAVLDKAVQSSLPKDHEIEANHPDYFFFLLKGAVKLSCLSESGQERVVMRIGPGTLFNEVSHIHTSLFQSHSLHTLEECVVARFPKSILEDKDFFRQNPELACNLIHSLGIKAGAFFAQLFDSGLLEVSTRVSRSLYQLWQENGESESFSPGLTQSDLASTLGVHRSSLCRVIKALRQQGIIGKFTKTTLEILDPEALSREAGGMLFQHLSL